MTKEELLVENARLGQVNKEFAAADGQRRMEFAKAFSWFKKRNPYDYQDEYRMPTWPEIYIEIGKLLAARNFYDFEGNVSEIDVRLEGLERLVKKQLEDNSL